jgi:adenosyl cobinamide kinase/adenosyl cobinamide phosphate guanylyltransferase
LTTTLVLGGARSGKSAVAERLVATLPVPTSYLATALVDPADTDLLARVEAHRLRRPVAWRTVEVGAELAAALDDTVGTALVDALGTWVAAHPDLDPDVDGLLAALARRSGHTVLVSEEVGLGVHPSTEVGRRFRDVLGTVNAAVAAQADDVVLVVAGRVLPLERSPW